MANSRIEMLKMIAILAWLAATPARADFHLHGWETHAQSPNALRLDPAFSYYVTKSNYDASGVSSAPAGLERYSRVVGDVTAAYGLNPYLTFYGRLSWARVEILHSTQSGNAFGLADQSVGATASVWESKAPVFGLGTARLDLQAQADLPAYSNSSVAVGVPFLGDGTIDVTGGGFLTLHLSQRQPDRWSLVGGAGFTWRTDQFSSAIPWSAGLQLEQAEQGPLLKVAAHGVLSLKNDASTAATVTTGSGGSFYYQAVNPSLLTLRAEAGYQIARNVGLVATGSQSVFGQGAPSGFSAGIALRAAWGSGLLPKDPARLSPQDYGRSNQGFVNYAFEGRVVRANDRFNLVKIDKGRQDGVEVGQIFDIFLVKKDGSIGEAIARAKCTDVKSTEAALTITEYYKEVWIEEGFVVKRPLQ
jgi:hypothetical protein